MFLYYVMFACIGYNEVSATLIKLLTWWQYAFKCTQVFFCMDTIMQKP